MPEPATYVYCLVQSARVPSVKGAPGGMPGSGPPRALLVDRGIWAIVSDAPLERFSGDRLQEELQNIEAVSRHALAHASMIEFFFQRGPVIPLKLFTLFSQDERARKQLAGRGSAVRTLFARLRGFEEWGVRITASNVRRPDPAVRRPGPSVRRPGPLGPGSAPATGREYLVIKKRMNADDGAPSPGTRRDVSAALAALGTLAANVRKESFPPPGRGRPYVAGASFLVKATRREAWKKRVARLAASLDTHDHRIEVSGPWPPYHFTSRSKGAR